MVGERGGDLVEVLEPATPRMRCMGGQLFGLKIKKEGKKERKTKEERYLVLAKEGE